MENKHDATGVGPAGLLEPEGEADRREMIATVDRFIAKYYGERCTSLSGGCWCCIVWAARDMLNAAIAE